MGSGDRLKSGLTSFLPHSTETEEPSTASIETEETTVTSEFIKPEILVGTHREKEGKNKESHKEKEEKLKETLQPYDDAG